MAVSTWHYLPGKKTKWQNTGCKTTLLEAASHQHCLWCGNDVSASHGHLPHRSCWCFLGATGTGPIQAASPWKSALTDSPALCTSLCHHRHKIRPFWKVTSDKRWHAPHLLRQASTVDVHSFKRKVWWLTSWFGQNSSDCHQEGHLQWMWKMNRWLTGLAHQTFKNKIKFWWGENSK